LLFHLHIFFKIKKKNAYLIFLDGCQFDQRTGRLRLKGKVLKHVIVNTGEVDLQLDSEIATEAVSKSTSTKHVQMRRITIFEIDLDQTWPLDIPSREPIAGQECWSYTRELMPVDDVQNASEALEKAKRASFDPERQF